MQCAPSHVVGLRKVSMPPRFEIVDFEQLAGVPCPCGTARRAFADAADFPGTVHVTDISVDAKVHYHKRLTETYYILECGPDAKMELDQDVIDLRPGLCILIRPGVRHRAIGKMKVLIVAVPKFDPSDEWFD
jgi:mannose-6-phosphate isomerase-like protein (cupin superfamily)